MVFNSASTTKNSFYLILQVFVWGSWLTYFDCPWRFFRGRITEWKSLFAPEADWRLRVIPFFFNPPHPSQRMAGFHNVGLGLFLLRSQQWLEPSNIFSKVLSKSQPLRFHFLKRTHSKLGVRISAILVRRCG